MLRMEVIRSTIKMMYLLKNFLLMEQLLNGIWRTRLRQLHCLTVHQRPMTKLVKLFVKQMPMVSQEYTTKTVLMQYTTTIDLYVKLISMEISLHTTLTDAGLRQILMGKFLLSVTLMEMFRFMITITRLSQIITKRLLISKLLLILTVELFIRLTKMETRQLTTQMALM